MKSPFIRTQTELDLQSLKEFVAEVVIPTSRRCDESEEFPIQIYRGLHEMGWLQAFIPGDVGGTGASGVDLACIYRELAYGSGGVFSSSLVNLLGMSPVLLYGRPELRARLARDFLERFSLWSYAMTEPDTGSNISKLRTRARKVKGGYILNGKKCFITNAGYSEHMSVFARMEDSNPDKPAITAFYVPWGTAGLTRGAKLRKMGQRDSNTGELYFDEVFVPDDHLLGEEGKGLRIAFRCLQRSKAMIAAAGVGICQRASDLVKDHLRQRVLYDRPLMDLAAIQHVLARMHTGKEAAWLLACQAVSVWDQGEFAVLEASMAKLFSADHTVSFVSDALELFGGYGYCREYEIEKLYRDAKILEIYEGPSLVQEQLVFRELFPEAKSQGKAESGSDRKAA